MTFLLSKPFVLAAVALGAILLARGWLAFILGWALPGLGHWIVGERARAVRVAVGVLGLFVTGVLIGGVDSVDQREDGPWFLAQAWAGPVAYIADSVNEQVVKRGRLPGTTDDRFTIGELLPSPGPQQPGGGPTTTVSVSSFKGLGTVNDVGTLFTSLAGLMNIVAMLDAASRARRKAAAEELGEPA